MAENSIQEWLADCKNLSPVEIHSFASTLIESHDLIHSIFNVLENKIKQHQLVEPVCNQLFSFYRLHEVELQHFVVQFVPTLIGVYLSSLGNQDLNVEFNAHRAVEVLILGIYNLDVVNAHGKPLIHSFHLPSLAQPSIYHESLSTITTTDNILRGMDKTEPHVVTLGPFPQVDTINGQNRLWVLTILMNIYNANLSFIPKSSLRFMCRMCSRLVKQGFFRPGHHQRSSYGNESLLTNLTYQRANQRILLSSSLLLELLHAVYFAMYNDHYQVAVQALEDIHIRATYEMFVEVLLVTNAIRSSLKLSPSGQALEEPMGINVALSPSTPTPNLTKAIITNASFRTKKLPDDIPIQEANEKPLQTISEEQEEISNNDKDKEKKAIRVKEKISVGNLLAKAKGIRKENDISPAPSKSKEKRKSDDSISIVNKLSNTSLSGKQHIGEDGKAAAPSIRSSDSKVVEEVDTGARNFNGRRSNDMPEGGGGGKSLHWRGDVISSEGKSFEVRGLIVTDDVTSRTAVKIQNRNGKMTGISRKAGTENMEDSFRSDPIDTNRSGDFAYNRCVDGISPGLGSNSDPSSSSSSSRRGDEISSNAVLRIVDGRIAEISRSVDSVRLSNGKSMNRSAKTDLRIDDESLDGESSSSCDIPELNDRKKSSRLSDPWLSSSEIFESRLDSSEDNDLIIQDGVSPRSDENEQVLKYGGSRGMNEVAKYSLMVDNRKITSPANKSIETRIEMNPLINHKQDLSDSSEETEQSCSLDVSNSLSNVSVDSDEEYLQSRSVERKIQRESVHTFV